MGRGQCVASAVPFLDLIDSHRILEDALVAAFRRSLQAGEFVGGPEITAFEDEFARAVGDVRATAVSSGTDALRFAYKALGIPPGGEVITVPNTFIATTEALTQAAGRIRFVDVDAATLTMDPRGVAAAITSRTVGLVPVHLYGQPADMDPLLDIAARHGLWVDEDAAQAHGAAYKGRAVGTLGSLAAFSFYPAKNLGACGEGGAVVGRDPTHIEMVRRLRDHGQSRKYYHELEGYNGRMDSIQAAFLRVKLPYLEKWNDGRRRAAEHYREALADIGEITLPVEAAYARHVYHLFVIRAERRDALRAYLTERQIGTGLHYPVPLHLQKAYQGVGWGRGAFPVVEQAADTILSLPMFPGLTSEQISHVADTIRAFYRS